MAQALVSREPFFNQLKPLIGKTVRVVMENKINSGTLTIWTAENGNEGWLVKAEKGKIIFSGELVDRVDIPLIGEPVVHISF